ncbi:hypothetical protein Leryth_005699 [Lithospermum erythrorhizon]|nr:hypothetical protein Leryth_005699 [Lithospermum erythrorhizon]
MGSKAVDELIEASSGAHFSGFHLDDSRQSSADVEQPSVTGDVHKQPFVIDDCFSMLIVQSEHFAGVAGGAASGKTAVCDMIIEQLPVSVLCPVTSYAIWHEADSFYHDLTPEELARVHDYNFDHPDAYDTEKLLCIMEKLKNWQAVDIPRYDFKSYKKNVLPARRVTFHPVDVSKSIVVEHGLGHLPFTEKHVTTPTGAVYTGAVYTGVDLRLCGVCSRAPQGVHVVCKRFPRIKIVTSEIEHGLNDDFRVVPGMGEFGDRYFGTDDD